MSLKTYNANDDQFPEAVSMIAFFGDDPVRALQFFINASKVIMANHGSNFEEIFVNDLKDICSEYRIIVCGDGKNSSVISIMDHEEHAILKNKYNGKIPREAIENLVNSRRKEKSNE